MGEEIDLDSTDPTFVHPASVAGMANQIQELMQSAINDTALTKVQKMTMISQGCKAVLDLIHCQAAVVAQPGGKAK